MTLLAVTHDLSGKGSCYLHLCCLIYRLCKICALCGRAEEGPKGRNAAQGYFYYMFGFCFLVAILTVLITIEVAIVCTYVQLCAEDYLWWYVQHGLSFALKCKLMT